MPQDFWQENLCMAQEVEYVKQEAKLVYLLECLQKTAPPVLVFAEKTADVDDIHEYLLVKGVEAVAVHGGKDQEEREAAIDEFKVKFSLLLLLIALGHCAARLLLSSNRYMLALEQLWILDAVALCQAAWRRIHVMSHRRH